MRKLLPGRKGEQSPSHVTSEQLSPEYGHQYQGDHQDQAHGYRYPQNPIVNQENTYQNHNHVQQTQGQLMQPQRQTHGEGLLSVHALEKSFKKRPVVRGVSLNVARGEAVGLFGPNGAGKTTVFYMITGLVPPDEGKILIDGHDITQFPMYRRARLGIGYLPQESSIFRGLSVEDNIMAILELTERKKKLRQERLENLLEEFGIMHVRKSPAIALSGGERRRVEIARALASQPSYILLDEPFAGIDPKTVAEIGMLIRHLIHRGIGVLITEHDVRSALEITNRAYIIHDGQVLMEGTPEQVINNPDVRKYYLGNEFL